MASTDGPERRLPGIAVVAGLAIIGMLGVVLVALGLGGASGPALTPTPSVPVTATRSEAPTHLASPSPMPSVVSSSAPASGPATGDPLLSGLLDEADLPGLASPLGAQEGSAFDIDDAAFVANGGIRVVSRAWQSLADSGLAGVFDFRMQFPTEAAAAAYLAAAEPMLSEAATNGQSPVPSPPVIGVGRPGVRPRDRGRRRHGAAPDLPVPGRAGGRQGRGRRRRGGCRDDRCAREGGRRTRSEQRVRPLPGSPRPPATATPTPGPIRAAAHRRSARRPCCSSTCRPRSPRAASPIASDSGRASWRPSCARTTSAA